jgi:hypothetical protein
MFRSMGIAAVAGALALLCLGAPRAAFAGSGSDFSAIAGGWSMHGLSLEIAGDGQAVAHWRVYTWCSDLSRPAPCDSIIGNSIEDGGLAMLRFTSFDGSSATATVLMSSDSSVFGTDAPVILRLMPGGVAQIQPSRADPLVLCGPAFDPGAFATPPCGA